MAILDQYGRPVNVGSLTKPQAAPGMTGIRQIWAGSIASGLTPHRLARILAECDQGNLDAFLTLAEEMEERDLHYASVLGIRKRVISGIVPTIKPASDSAKDKEIAEQVRIRIAEHDGFSGMVEDLLDALGKGFAVVEIDWARTAKEWWPNAFDRRDPRWFVFDRTAGTELRVKTDGDAINGEELNRVRFIQHRAKLKSGLVYRGGLARLVAFSWMCKAYTLKDWDGVYRDLRPAAAAGALWPRCHADRCANPVPRGGEHWHRCGGGLAAKHEHRLRERPGGEL